MPHVKAVVTPHSTSGYCHHLLMKMASKKSLMLVVVMGGVTQFTRKNSPFMGQDNWLTVIFTNRLQVLVSSKFGFSQTVASTVARWAHCSIQLNSTVLLSVSLKTALSHMQPSRPDPSITTARGGYHLGRGTRNVWGVRETNHQNCTWLLRFNVKQVTHHTTSNQ